MEMPFLYRRFFLITLLLCAVNFAQADVNLTASQLIFPNAEGFGIESPAGRGGRVYRVTNLNDSGKGSLRECMDANEPRLCFFDVAGVIKLKEDLAIKNPFITIAGQTAPSPGVSLYGAGIRIYSHDILIQHIRVRVGDDIDGPSPINRDGIAIEGDGARNIVIDHCSVAWAIDENLAIWGEQIKNITISNSIIAEGLANSLHPKGSHSMGLLVGPRAKNIALIKNALLHNGSRNPLIRGGSTSIVINNLLHNSPWTAVTISDRRATYPTYSDVIGNVVTKGNDSNNINKTVLLARLAPGSRVHASDNRCATKSDRPFSCAVVVPEEEKNTLLSEAMLLIDDSVEVLGGDDVKGYIMLNAGARPNDRDAIDDRLITDIADGSGFIIDTPQEQINKYEKLYTWNEDAPAYALWRSGEDTANINIDEWLHKLDQTLSN